MGVNEDQTWAAQALCASTPPDQLFVQGAAQRQVRNICFGCPVRIECLADALDSRASYGVWGGLTERERRAMLRRYPEVSSWETWLRESDDVLAAELRSKHTPHVLAHARTPRKPKAVAE